MQLFRFKDLLPMAAILATTISCVEASNKNNKNKSDILTANIDTTINPADDFFEFACGKWIKSNKIPDDETTWGIANLVNEELYNRKLNINKDAVAASGKNTTQQQLADFWTAAMDTNKIDKAGIQPLTEALAKIDAAKTPADIMNVAAYLHTFGVGVFFNEGVGQDEKNSEVMSYQLFQGGLGLPNRDYYFNTDERTTKIRNAYPAYVQSIFRLKGDDSATAMRKATAIIALETTLAKSSRKIEDLRDPYKNYNKMDMAQLKATAPNIDWASVFTGIGLPKIDTVIVGQPEFYKALNIVVSKEAVQNLKDYMAFHLISDFAPYLSQNFVQAKFNFYSKTIRGAKQMRPRWKRVLDAEEGVIGEILGQLFVKEYFNETAKKRYEDMTEAVRNAYKARIEKLTWMSDSTKKKALIKLAGITKKVGYPDKWKDFSSLKIDQRSFASNMMRANAWWNNYSIQKLGKPVDRTEWNMTPQTYNAYYNPSNNEIVLPAGIFTVPGFRDEDLDDALVYGYAAASTIGHEITHGFDDQGRQYDEKGNLKNWWSKEDEEQFNKRASVLANQFSNMVVIDTMHINGKATLGENLADLGGILIGLDAFKQSKAFKENKTISGYTPLQRYFLGYALGWLYQVRQEQLASQLLTDVHSPAKFRVNGPFPNVPEFYQAFKIPVGSKMYLPDSVRVMLW
ncbi:MAG: M13 family metallopeptidase [Phycisphaerales bacterium]|nr:M13 family metallopeptidase [Phycisphaerales bacterium]